MPKSENHNNADPIQQQVEEIISAGALGKSDAFVRLLRFLAVKAETKKSVKEIEIAIEVFGRDVTFDVTQDSLVRVYIHKLRTKLDNFYLNDGSRYSKRLTIPKGSYLLQLEDNEATNSPIPILAPLANWRTLAMVFLSMAVGAATLAIVESSIERSQTKELVIESAIWSPLAEASRPLLVVIGDIFMYSEVTAEFEQLREIRDFSIASAEEFESRLNTDASFAADYRDFGVRYLPNALASSLKQITAFLGSNRPWEIIMASQLEEEDIGQFDIIYLGHYTALNTLADLAFSSSSLMLHPNGSVLIQDQTGEVFVGTGQLSDGYRDRYVDYAVFRKTRLDSGNSLYFLMSARDPGLENLAEFVFSAEGTSAIQAQLSQPNEDFELLLEVSGSELEDLISQIRLIDQND